MALGSLELVLGFCRLVSILQGRFYSSAAPSSVELEDSTRIVAIT
jgi:hypothetical protein